MKKLLILLGISCSSLIFAQTTSGGPDNFGYTYKSSAHPSGPTYSWFDISTTGSLVSGLSDDNFVGPYVITGFPFYSTNPTQLFIGSNGYISFQPVNISSTNAQFPAIPQIGAPNNFIAPLLTDLSFGGNATNPAVAYYYDQGDTICITYDKVPFWINNTNQYGGDNSFQIILNKADSSITYNYKQQVGNPDPTYTSNYLSIGNENQSGNDGLQYYRGTVFPAPLTSIRFEYPNIIQNITDIELSYINNSRNGAEFISQNTPYSPSASIKNIGNQNVSNNITITTQILDPAGLISATFTKTIDSLASGIDSLVSFANFTPLVTGKFIVKSYVSQVLNDGVRSNDTNQVFFKVVDANTVTQELDYSTRISGPGIGWAGGNGGLSIYIEPPYYPAYINSTNFYINTVGSPPVGFHSVIYDDSGRGPGMGNVLDSVFVPSASILTGQYHQVLTSSPVTITSGGIYLLWLMDGDGINLGRSFTSPASQQTYEIIFGSWSEYRDKTTEDFLMNLEISPTPVGINEVENDFNIKIYPNPTQDIVTLKSDERIVNKSFEILDVNGKTLEVKSLKSDKKITFYIQNLSNGTYFIRLDKTVRQFVVQH